MGVQRVMRLDRIAQPYSLSEFNKISIGDANADAESVMGLRQPHRLLKKGSNIQGNSELKW